MTALRDTIARRYAGRTITLGDITRAFDVNETVARSVIADLKAMKLAKGFRINHTKPNMWTISPPVCVEARLIAEREDPL